MQQLQHSARIVQLVAAAAAPAAPPLHSLAPVVKPALARRDVYASVLQCARVSCTHSHCRFGVRRRLPLQDLGCKRRRRPSQLVRERRRGQRAMARSTWGAQARSPLSVSARTLLAASLHDHGVACARLPLRSRCASAIFECVLLAGSSLSPYNVIGLGWAYAWVGHRQSLWHAVVGCVHAAVPLAQPMQLDR